MKHITWMLPLACFIAGIQLSHHVEAQERDQVSRRDLFEAAALTGILAAQHGGIYGDGNYEQMALSVKYKGFWNSHIVGIEISPYADDYVRVARQYAKKAMENQR